MAMAMNRMQSVFSRAGLLAALLLAASFIAVPQDAQAALQRGPNNLSLTGYWSFDEGTSTTVGDLSGNGNTLTLRGNAAWGRGKRGSAFNAALLDAQAFGVLRNGGATDGPQTINLWYRVPAGLSARSALLTVRNAVPSSAGHHMMVYPATNSIGVERWAGGIVMQASSTAASIEGMWRMISFTYDGVSAYRLYDNGSLVSSTNITGLASSLIQELVVSGYATSTTDAQLPAGSSVDDIRIFRRALSAQEISNLYRIGGTPRRTVSNQGLLGYWSFDEGDGLQAGDSSGNRNLGVLTNGATWGSGKRGRAVALDGANDYVAVDPGANLNITDNTYTLSLWYRKAVSNEQGQLLRKGQGGANGYGIVIGPAPDGPGCANDQINFFRFNSTNYCLGSVPADTNWHHLIVTQSASGLRSYVDGVQNGSNGNTFAPFSTSDIFALGEGTNAASSWFGSIDEVRVYDRVLSDDEIRILATQSDYLKLNSTPTRTVSSGLIGYWPFDGRFMNWTTNRALDASPGGNSALLNNMSTTTSPMIGKIGQALNFDGVNDVASVSFGGGDGDPYSDLGSMSVCAWVNPASMPVGYAGIVSRSSGASNGWQFYLYDGGSETAGLGFFNTDGDAVERSRGVFLGSWQHVCGTWDGNAGLSGRKLYMNGAELDTTTLGDYGSGSSDAPYNFDIGTLGSGTYLFQGGIDDVRLYDRELTAAEVRRIYNAGQ